ncbi:glycosyltransferase [bacterium]|nr:glycosyltransferase [bacterium]MBU1290761.1 glycosyltransferase [bacterium]MBU1427444.1 glycosyltransferase [bacterium]MBU2440542.1 glycosyltransferase [bacterium]
MISIIIPALNEENYLPRLLGSLEKQNLKDYEIILADAGSKDRTIEIAKKYGCKVVPGGLPAKGRNEGAKAARGDLFLFLDSDLVLPEGFLDVFLQEFKKKNLDIASTDLDFLTDKKIYKIAAFLCNIYYRCTQRILPHISQCILVKKEFHNRIGGFDEEIKLSEDFAYIKKMCKIAKFGHISKIKFYSSARRFEKDGLINTFLKYLLAHIYIAFFGPIKSDIFKYRFNHYSKSKKNNFL